MMNHLDTAQRIAYDMESLSERIDHMRAQRNDVAVALSRVKGVQKGRIIKAAGISSAYLYRLRKTLDSTEHTFTSQEVDEALASLERNSIEIEARESEFEELRVKRDESIVQAYKKGSSASSISRVTGLTRWGVSGGILKDVKKKK